MRKRKGFKRGRRSFKKSFKARRRPGKRIPSYGSSRGGIRL